MIFAWQNLIVLAIVAIAACYLARVMWRSIALKKSGCGGCGTCPSNTAAKEPHLVGIQPLDKNGTF